MGKILLIGNDSSLVVTRAAVLRQTRAGVTECSSSEITAQSPAERYKLVVLCHSVPAS